MFGPKNHKFQFQIKWHTWIHSMNLWLLKIIVWNVFIKWIQFICIYFFFHWLHNVQWFLVCVQSIKSELKLISLIFIPISSSDLLFLFVFDKTKSNLTSALNFCWALGHCTVYSVQYKWSILHSMNLCVHHCKFGKFYYFARGTFCWKIEKRKKIRWLHIILCFRAKLII